MKIRGIEVSKIACIVIERRIIWMKSNDCWSRKISNSEGIEVKTEYRTPQDMVNFLNTKYFNNRKYKMWISPFVCSEDGLYFGYNTLNIIRIPPQPPKLPDPGSRTQIYKTRIARVVDAIKSFDYACDGHPTQNFANFGEGCKCTSSNCKTEDAELSQPEARGDVCRVYYGKPIPPFEVKRVDTGE